MVELPSGGALVALSRGRLNLALGKYALSVDLAEATKVTLSTIIDELIHFMSSLTVAAQASSCRPIIGVSAEALLSLLARTIRV